MEEKNIETKLEMTKNEKKENKKFTEQIKAVIESFKKFFMTLSTLGKVAFVVAVLMVPVFLWTMTPKLLQTHETALSFGFKDVGKLVTQEWYGRIIEDSSKDRTLFSTFHIPFTKSRLIFSLDVEVLAGVDFSDIDYEISQKNKKVIVTLPHAEIYKAYEVQYSFIPYLDEESLFTKIDAQEQQAMKDNIIEKGKKIALDAGLLKKADSNAEKIIRYMIIGNSLTRDFDVHFKYK